MFSEQKLAEEGPIPQKNLKKYHIFFSTAHPDSHDKQFGTGDVNYIQTMVDAINSQKFVRQKALHIRNIFNEIAIYNFIKEHAINHFPILHVMINAAQTDFVFTIEGLTRFKQWGGQLVITPIELTKYQSHPAALQYEKMTIEYLKVADQVIFLNKNDKETALAFQQTPPLDSEKFLLKLQSAEVLDSECVGKAYGRVEGEMKKWTLSALHHWQAYVHKKRSYGIMEKRQSLNIPERASENLKALLKRLKTGNDLDAPEMRTSLQNKKKSEDVLTLEERKFFINMLQREWVLKHVTDFMSIEKMKENDGMLSLEERTRRGITTDNSHTNPAEGHSDNVFFTYGPGKDLPTVRFMDKASYVITVDPELLSTNSSKTWRGIPNALQGMWGSDHFYAYATEQEGIPIIVGDCRYSVSYRNTKEGETGVHLVKICQYDRKDGTSATQIIEKGNEIFVYPHISQGIVLSVIEKVRLMGFETWDLVMNKMSPEEQEKLVQTLYHAGVFEVHKPRSFSLNHRGVEIINRESKNVADNTTPFTLSQSMIESAYQGTSKEVLKFCKNNENFSKISGNLCQGAFTVNLLGAAILGGHAELVKALLDMSYSLDEDINTFVNITSSAIQQKTSPAPVSISLLMLVFCLNNPRECWQITPKKAAANEILKLLVKRGTTVRRNSHIRHPLAVTSKDIEMGLELFRAEPEHVLYLINTLEKQLNPNDLPLELSVNTGALSLVEKILSFGVDVDNCFQANEKFSGSELGNLESGFTALLIAVAQGNEPMVQLLLKNNAPIEQEFCASDSCLLANPAYKLVHRFEGYTPLLMAVEKGHHSLVQLFVNKNANLLHRSATGKAAISIAKEKGFKSILSILQEATKNSANEEAGNLIKSSKIQHHYTRVIFTGKDAEEERFFLVYSPEEKIKFSTFIASIPTKIFNGLSSKEKIFTKITTILNQYVGLELQPNTLRCSSIPQISCYLPADEMYYAENIVVCDLDDVTFKKVKEKMLSSQHNSSIQLVAMSALMREQSEKLAHIEDPWPPKITHSLLTQLNAMFSRNNHNISKEEHETLNACYNESLNEQHQILQAARTGDITELENLINQGAVLWHRTPTSEVIADFNQGDLGRVPLQMALKNNQLNCAAYILSVSSPDSLPNLDQFVSLEVLFEIIKNGHLELYKTIYEKKRLVAFSIIPELVYSLLFNAIENKHTSLVHYITNSIGPNSGNAFVAMIEAAESGNYNQALKLLNGLPENFKWPQVLNAVFRCDLIYAAVCAGHLEFYKVIHDNKSGFTDPVKNEKSVLSFLDGAILNQHEPLVLYILGTFRPNEADRLKLLKETQAQGLIQASTLLSSQMPMQNPRSFTFMRTRHSEIYNQKWMPSEKGQSERLNYKKYGYGLGASGVLDTP